MSRKKTDTNDIEAARAELASLRSEARSFGIYVTVDTLSEVRDVVSKIRAGREGMPPCYWRSYDKMARECRICEVRNDCARGDLVPDHVPTEELKQSLCGSCGGALSVEIVDRVTGLVLDYGCDSPDCETVLSGQAKPPKATPPRRKVVVPEGTLKKNLAVADRIMAFLNKNPGSRVVDVVRGTGEDIAAKTKRDQIKALQKAGRVEKTRSGREVLLFVSESETNA